MPNLPISQLPDISGSTLGYLSPDAEFAVAQDGVTYKVKESSVNPITHYGSFIFDSNTTLTANIQNGSTTSDIEVVSTTGFASAGYIKIGSEIIGYTSKTSASFVGITRSVASSNGTSHSIGDYVTQAQWSPAQTPAQVILDETLLSSGVTLSGVGDVTVVSAGTYNFQFSIQFENFGNDYADAAVWFKLNGNNISKTASYTTISQSHGGTPGATIMTVNIFHTCAAGDVMSLWWRNREGLATITSIAPVDGTIPQSPGVIFTVNQIV